jgi:hypothetical protein
VPVEKSFAAWRKDPTYVAAYNALEDEFARTAAMTDARACRDRNQSALRLRYRAAVQTFSIIRARGCVLQSRTRLMLSPLARQIEWLLVLGCLSSFVRSDRLPRRRL